jgi:hypothetical protein
LERLKRLERFELFVRFIQRKKEDSDEILLLDTVEFDFSFAGLRRRPEEFR